MTMTMWNFEEDHDPIKVIDDEMTEEYKEWFFRQVRRGRIKRTNVDGEAVYHSEEVFQGKHYHTYYMIDYEQTTV